jgi:hypothetical protein
MNIKYWHSLIIIFLISIALLSCSGAATPKPASQDNSTVPTSQDQEDKANTAPTVDKSKLPVIQFSVAPNLIAPGGSAVLTWSVSNATIVTIDHGVGVVPLKGTKSVSPTAPTNYKLTAGNESGSAIKIVSLAVVVPETPAKPPAK